MMRLNFTQSKSNFRYILAFVGVFGIFVYKVNAGPEAPIMPNMPSMSSTATNVPADQQPAQPGISSSTEGFIDAPAGQQPLQTGAPSESAAESANIQAGQQAQQVTLPKAPGAPVAIQEKKSELVKEAVTKQESTEDTKGVAGSQIDGLDTVSVREPEGNWLLKRVWWEKAQKKYEKIKDGIVKIVDSRTPFLEKRNNLEKSVLNPFYTEIGLKSGQMSQIVDELLSRAKKEREENITLDVKERELLDLVKAEEANIKQLEADINGIKALDDAIDSDLLKLDEQISRCQRYGENAWQLFIAIARELNHKKAREFYYKMDALWQNVKSIDAYIKDAFSKHFDLIIENANSQVNRIKETVAKFKEKGLDLKKKYKEIILKKEPSAEEKAAAAKAQAEKEAKEAAEKEEAERGVFSKIWDGFKWPFVKVWDFFTSFWTSSEQDDSSQDQKPVVNQPKAEAVKA